MANVEIPNQEQLVDEIFNPKNESKSQFIKWGKIGDWFKGTLTDVREIESQFPGKEGEKVKIYEFKAHNGSFHEIDANKQPVEPAITVKADEYWIVGGRAGIDQHMRNTVKGEIVAFRFTELKPSKTKGFNASKIIKVYKGGLDPNYIGESAAESKDVPF